MTCLYCDCDLLQPSKDGQWLHCPQCEAHQPADASKRYMIETQIRIMRAATAGTRKAVQEIRRAVMSLGILVCVLGLAVILMLAFGVPVKLPHP